MWLLLGLWDLCLSSPPKLKLWGLGNREWILKGHREGTVRRRKVELRNGVLGWRSVSSVIPECGLSPSPLAVWNRIIEPVAAMRKEADMLRLFPEYLKGEELFGLTVHAVLRIAESVRRQRGAAVAAAARWALGALVLLQSS